MRSSLYRCLYVNFMVFQDRLNGMIKGIGREVNGLLLLKVDGNVDATTVSFHTSIKHSDNVDRSIFL